MNSSTSCTSSVDETRNDRNLGSTKKRQILKKCKEVIASLNDVCTSTRKLFLCPRELLVFGVNDEKEEVRDIISDEVDIAMEAMAKGVKRGLTDIFTSQTYDHIFASSRVPDWVLPYFKFKTRLPYDTQLTAAKLHSINFGRWPIFKMVSFLEYLVFFRALFCTKKL